MYCTLQMLRSILCPHQQDATVTHNLPSYEGSTSIFIARYDQTIPEEEHWSKSCRPGETAQCWETWGQVRRRQHTTDSVSRMRTRLVPESEDRRKAPQNSHAHASDSARLHRQRNTSLRVRMPPRTSDYRAVCGPASLLTFLS